VYLSLVVAQVQVGGKGHEPGGETLGVATDKMKLFKMTMQRPVIAKELVWQMQMLFAQVALVMLSAQVRMQGRQVVKAQGATKFAQRVALIGFAMSYQSRGTVPRQSIDKVSLVIDTELTKSQTVLFAKMLLEGFQAIKGVVGTLLDVAIMAKEGSDRGMEILLWKEYSAKIMIDKIAAQIIAPYMVLFKWFVSHDDLFIRCLADGTVLVFVEMSNPEMAQATYLVMVARRCRQRLPLWMDFAIANLASLFLGHRGGVFGVATFASSCRLFELWTTQTSRSQEGD
jgi:hypothetical protein